MRDTIRIDDERQRRTREKARQAIDDADDLLGQAEHLAASEQRHTLQAKRAIGTALRRGPQATTLVDPTGLSASELAEKVAARNQSLLNVEPPKAIKCIGVQGYV